MCPPCSQPLFWLPEGSTDEPPESSRGQREGCHSCLRSPAAQRPPRAPGNKPHPAYITKKGHFLSLKVCPAYSLLPPPGVSGFQGSVSEKFRTFNHTYPWTSRYVPGATPTPHTVLMSQTCLLPPSPPPSPPSSPSLSPSWATHFHKLPLSFHSSSKRGRIMIL